MKKILFLSVFVCGLFLASFIFVQSADAKTVKEMVVKSIDHDEKTLKAIKNGDTYTVNAANAKIRKGKTGSNSMSFSRVKEGDVVTIEGSFDDTDVTATKVRNLSYNNKKTVTFYGTIDSITSSTKTIKIDTLDRDKQTIAVLDSTDITNSDDDEITFSDLKEDDKILVRGKWSDSKNTITKTKWIQVLDSDDYEYLDD